MLDVDALVDAILEETEIGHFHRGDFEADNAVLRSLFPDVEPVSLDQGLTDTLAWFKEIS